MVELNDLMKDFIDSCIDDICISLDAFELEVFNMEKELINFECWTPEIERTFKLKVSLLDMDKLERFLKG
jgi:hypothetical protein